MAIAVDGPRQAEPRLIERSAQLAALDESLGAAAQRSGRFALIRGEAGIGKTALVRAFLARADSVSRVITAGCEDLSTPRPLAPLHEVAELLGGDLGRLLAENAAREEIAASVLHSLSSDGLQVLVVEDLQWADDATLDLVRYLARRIHLAPALMVATYREDVRTRPALRFVLGDVATAPATRQIRLSPLSVHGVAQMAQGQHPDPRELHRLTAGNPFFVAEVLAAGGQGIPISVRDTIRARIGRLDQRAIYALEGAAIIGTSVEPWLLAAVLGEALPGIDDCLAAGLVQTEAGRIAFSHELTRMTVLEDLPVFKGIGLHRRALDVLLRSGHGNQARLAYHAEGAADSEAVLRHAGEAARDALAMEAHREAAEQLQRALRFAGGLDDLGRVELLEQLAAGLFLTGFLEEADRARSEAIALCRRLGHWLRMGNNLRLLARYRLFSHGAAQAISLAEEALEVLSPLGESRELALAYCVLGHIAMYDQKLPTVAAWSERALDLGARLGDQEAISYALNNLGTAELLDGRPEGRAKLERSLEIARAGQFSEHIDRALMNMAEVALLHRDLKGAEQRLTDLAEYNAASQIELCNLNSNWAGAMLELGRWDDAEQYADLGVGHQKASPSERAVAATILAQLAVRRGQEHARELIADADRFRDLCADPDLALRTASTSLHAEAAWLAGDLLDVTGALEEVRGRAIERRDAWALGEVERWLWRAGRLERPHRLTAKPYALQISGDYRAASSEWERLGIPYDSAVCLADSDDPADLRAAYDRLVELGAVPVAHRIALKIRERGGVVPRGPRPTTRGNSALLTQRETEVADLLAKGLSNAEIAERLVLSHKTVAHHVSAVLGKLGVRRRGGVAAALEQVTAG